jgi:hypothetical protein
MEVKFSENPSDAWSSSQWSTHIDDLNRFYARVPPGEEVPGSPQYLIISNSTLSSIDDLGSNYSNTLTSYATTKGVNVAHLRLVREDGAYFLSGDLISAADALNWIGDLLRDIKFDFIVSCQKEN